MLTMRFSTDTWRNIYFSEVKKKQVLFPRSWEQPKLQDMPGAVLGLRDDGYVRTRTWGLDP